MQNQASDSAVQLVSFYGGRKAIVVCWKGWNVFSLHRKRAIRPCSCPGKKHNAVVLMTNVREISLAKPSISLKGCILWLQKRNVHNLFLLSFFWRQAAASHQSAGMPSPGWCRNERATWTTACKKKGKEYPAKVVELLWLMIHFLATKSIQICYLIDLCFFQLPF